MVYVDRVMTITPQVPEARRHGSRWCHMWADTDIELHAMAARIGLKREWFQARSKVPHYDVVPSKRSLALQAGAREGSMRDRLRAAIYGATARQDPAR